MSRNGSFLSLARAMNCGTFSIVPISINILNAPSLAPPCAGPQRHANSLIPRFNSLLEFKKFPVRLRREFACKPLNLLIDWHKNRTERQESANFPVNFPVSREFASQTGSRLTVSSATQFGLLAGFSWSVKIADIPAGEAGGRRSLAGNFWHFRPLGAGFGRRSLVAIFQFPFRRSGDGFDC